MRKISIDCGRYTLRNITEKDSEQYYKFAFAEPDEEANFYTGTVEKFTKEQIDSYVKIILKDETRYDFLIEIDNEIIGEIVLSEIKNSKCHYRICLYKKENFSKGIGYICSLEVFNYAFNELGIHEIELEVFPFNIRGIALYQKVGFKKIDTIIDNEAIEPYKEIIVMTLKNKDFNIKNKNKNI